MIDNQENLDIEDLEEEEEVYVSYEIASYPSDLTLSVLSEMWKNDDIVIPSFQRKFVWTIKQSSLLIESFLLGLPVPQLFFYVDDKNRSIVIDGQQRILSTVFYFEGYFGPENIVGKRQVFRLTGLGDKNPFNNKRFADLDEADQRKLRGSVLRAINIKQLNPRGETTSIYHIFERLNTGGTPLKAQEIRNCVFRGEFADILSKLNDDENWRTIIGKKTLDKHQKDIELILRVFALSMNIENYEKPMKEFLNTAMSQHREGKSKKVRVFQENFPKITKLISSYLGDKPFNLRGPLNSSVLDSVICTLLDYINRIPKDLPERYSELVKDKEYQDATSYGTSDTVVVQSRFARAKFFLIR